MGMLAAYYYFFEPYFPQVEHPEVIDSIFRMFPVNYSDSGWVMNDNYPMMYESRRV